jgi:predicted secreted acid phosphatase
VYANGQGIDRAAQRRVLDQALARAAAGGVAVFDLDSTLLDNRPRQARILREYGASVGVAALTACTADHWSSWDIAQAMRACGCDERTIAAHAGPAKKFWWERFFTSEYCKDDRAIAGAPEFVRAVAVAGAQVAYVTGRHVQMEEGTRSCLGRIGFPLPPGEGKVHLLLKPTFDLHDDAWKEEAYARLDRIGQVALAFDNEPTHINGYAARFPGALCVHLATDDSGRPVPLAPGVPSIASFAR